MNDIDIIEQEGDEVLWRYKDNDGSSYVNDDGKAIDAILCAVDLLLTPRAVRCIKRAVAEWVAEAPDRAAVEAANKALNKKCALIHNAWENWKRTIAYPVYYATPAVDTMPQDRACDGWAVFIAYPDYPSDGGEIYTSPVIKNPTWGQVLAAFDASLIRTKVFSHLYLEGLFEAEPEEHPEGLNVADNIKVFRFSAGS